MVTRFYKLPVFLDHMSTTPVDPWVLAQMLSSLQGEEENFGNSSSLHAYGHRALESITLAREQVANLIHADPREIVWTSGATESNNLAIKGACQFYRRQGNHVITMTTEHKSVLEPCLYMAEQGMEVTYLKPQKTGLLDLQELKETIRPGTILVSVMHANNETGVIQNIEAIGALVKTSGALFHVDAAQSVGKIPIDLSILPVDLMSFSAHKLYGPKGIGALYVKRRPRVRLIPQIHGGGHEQGVRSGTLPTHQIVGMGAAFALAKERFLEDHQRSLFLRNRLWGGLQAIGGIHSNVELKHVLSNCLNFRVSNVVGEMLLNSLTDVAISTGAACNAMTAEPSPVLLAMGLSREDAFHSLRLSVGRFTTVDEIDYVISHFQKQIQELRDVPTPWATVLPVFDADIKK